MYRSSVGVERGLGSCELCCMTTSRQAAVAYLSVPGRRSCQPGACGDSTQAGCWSNNYGAPTYGIRVLQVHDAVVAQYRGLTAARAALAALEQHVSAARADRAAEALDRGLALGMGASVA